MIYLAQRAVCEMHCCGCIVIHLYCCIILHYLNILQFTQSIFNGSGLFLTICYHEQHCCGHSCTSHTLKWVHLLSHTLCPTLLQVHLFLFQECLLHWRQRACSVPRIQVWSQICLLVTPRDA